MSGRGVYKRGDSWWITYRLKGKEMRESVARVLGIKPSAVTEADAQRVLDDRRRRNGLRPKSLGGKIVGYTPSDVLVSNAARSLCFSGPGPVIFNGPDLRLLFGPAVYAFFVAGEAVYVGSTVQGLTRALSPRHHALGSRKLGQAADDEHIVLWPAESEQEARALEMKAIRELRPLENRTKYGHPSDTDPIQGVDSQDIHVVPEHVTP